LELFLFGINQICHPSNNRLQEDMEVCVKHEVPIIIGAIAASLAMGADMAYIGTRFIATAEANAEKGYKDEIVESSGEDIVLSSLFTGVHGNYLKGSIEKAGLDPNNLPEADKSTMNFGSGGNTEAKAWKDIWGAGQGVGSVKTAPPVSEVVEEMYAEYVQACKTLASKLA